jgi:hypothetical protein
MGLLHFLTTTEGMGEGPIANKDSKAKENCSSDCLAI